MEIVQEFSSQFMLYLPVSLVIVGAILVFTFGFKSVEQPSFHNLTNDERKSLGKKKKLKEKKSTVNGQVPIGDRKNEKSPKKTLSKEVVESKHEKKETKVENKQQEKLKKTDMKAKLNVDEAKVKKTVKKVVTEKPTDFDDGDWEMVPSKSDKKKKLEQSPTINNKKSKKNAKTHQTDIEKSSKKNDNKEVLAENFDNSTVTESFEAVSKDENVMPTEEPAIIEEKPVKKEKKPKSNIHENVNNESNQKTELVAEHSKPDVEVSDPKNDKPAAPVFDELVDTWTEAKTVKKSKKKARRDN